MMETNTESPIKQKSTHKYKDTLFRTLFSEKSRAIELCNAVAGTNYGKDAAVTIHDMENALLRRYNDLIAAFEDQLIAMFEHQSTINPNMPLRFLPNITDALYSWYVDVEKIYKSTTLKIPTPQFYVLYNGEEKLKCDVLKLSDAFKIKPTGPSLELTVKVIDVNYESNHEVLHKSESLGGYAYLIAQIRNYESTGLKRDAAINKGIQKCIDEGILADFLSENLMEVAKMLSWEYCQETEFKVLREEGREEGREENKIETAIEMFKEGFEIPIISKITQMPLEWVKEVIAPNETVETA